jgi:hypothetical protein
MASRNQSTRRKIDPVALRTAQRDGHNLMTTLAASSPPAAMPLATTDGGSGVIGDTPFGIKIDYEGALSDDIPVGSLQDSQVVALIKNALLAGNAPFFFRFHSQIFVRAGA